VIQCRLLVFIEDLWHLSSYSVLQQSCRISLIAITIRQATIQSVLNIISHIYAPASSGLKFHTATRHNSSLKLWASGIHMDSAHIHLYPPPLNSLNTGMWANTPCSECLLQCANGKSPLSKPHILLHGALMIMSAPQTCIEKSLIHSIVSCCTTKNVGTLMTIAARRHTHKSDSVLSKVRSG